MAAPALRALIGAAAAPQRDDSRRGWLIALAAASPLLLLLALVVGILVLLAGDLEQRRECAPGSVSGPGPLGGVAGTGLTHAQVRAVRATSPHAGPAFTTGAYDTTAYGPPWGGINGSGLATSGGIHLAGGAPRMYMIAVDPRLIGHGQLVHIWPNPFGWRGPFLAADTGAAIQGRRIDFYDWRGRTTQLRWGHTTVQVSDRPINADPGTGAGGCAAGAVSTRVGERIGQLARSHLGSGPSIPGFTPASVSYAWCAWFATNVWKQAGVPIPVSPSSGYPYDWAAARGQLFKRIGALPKGRTPPVGSALMYGINSAAPLGSWHVNLVDRVLADGSFMVTGGNQGKSQVTRYGPCRLQRADPARLLGPGCDGRPIYGIAAPTKTERA